jgi:hypothetical protein
MLKIYESINGEIESAVLTQFAKTHPEYDIDTVNTDFEKKYPLLEHLQTYNYNEIIGHVAHYINLIDKEQGEQNV